MEIGVHVKVVLGSCLAVGMIASAGHSKGTADDQSGVWKPVLPDAVFVRLVSHDAKILQDALAKEKLEKKDMARARCSAAMIAAYAQTQMLNGGPNAPKLAGLRDLALKADIAVKENRLDEAKKLAAALSPAAGSDGSAKTAPVELNKHTDLDIIMHQFKAERSGGLDLEKKFHAQVKHRGKLTADNYKEIVPMTYQFAVIAQYAETMAPERDEGAKKRNDWINWSQEMGQLSLATAKAAQAPKPDDRAVKDLLMKIDANCTSCHKVFRIDQ